MFPTFAPKCTLMLTGGLYSEIHLAYQYSAPHSKLTKNQKSPAVS